MTVNESVCFSCNEVRECVQRDMGNDVKEIMCEDCWDEMMGCENCEVVQYYEYMYMDSDGDSYCEGCYDMLIDTCDECYEARKDCERYGEDGLTYCESCLEDIKGRERVCDECEAVSDDTKRWYNSQYVDGYIELCGGCGAECYCCMEFKKVEDYEVNDGSVKLCEECREEVFRCEECGDLYNVEFGYGDSLGNLYCEDCYECEIKMCDKCEENVKDCVMIGWRYYCEVCKEDVCQKCGSHSDEFGVKVVEVENGQGTSMGMFCEDCIEDSEGNIGVDRKS